MALLALQIEPAGAGRGGLLLGRFQRAFLLRIQGQIQVEHGSLAGEGQGRIPEVIADAVKMRYTGFATMEPHLLGGGPTGGVTGPELFPKAVAAFKGILERAGAKYQ